MLVSKHGCVSAVITILVLRMDRDGAQMWAGDRHAVEFLTLKVSC